MVERGRSVTVDLDSSIRLYDASWTPALRALRKALGPHRKALADDLCTTLERHAGTGYLVQSLSAPQRAAFKKHLVNYLDLLTASRLTSRRHQAALQRFGRWSSCMGVLREDMVHGHALLLAAVRLRVDATQHPEALSVFGQRLLRSIELQLREYRQLQTARHLFVQELIRIVWQADSRADLINRVSDQLTRHEEFASSAFSGLDEQGVYRFENVSSELTADYLLELEQRLIERAGGSITLGGHGPVSRVWRSRKVERSINIETDPTLTPWADIYTRREFRSFVALPISHPGGMPSFVLQIHSRVIGGFSSPEQTAFLEQMQRLLMLAISYIENRQGHAPTVPYAVRQRWAGLLRTEALEMHYQPLLELRTGRIVKVEALARLRDGDQLLTPDTFLPALHADDLVELYEQGLSQVLRQKVRWQGEDGIDLSASINLPSSALADGRYFDITKRLLAEYRCPPGGLTLELLETGESVLGTSMARGLEKFRALGVDLAEDDLGSGYSGLGRLREMPFDLIKIDRSIIRNAENDAFDVLRFLYQLTRLGHSLGKTVAVEGIEDEALLEAVMIVGADVAQGYAVARPMPAADVAGWMHAWRPPLAFDRQKPRSRLAKLARLLVWEEQLHMWLEEGPYSHGADHQDRAVPAPPPLLPLGVEAQALQKALIEIALLHRMNSAQYRALRSRLIDVLE